jgi:hypothetical protein
MMLCHIRAPEPNNPQMAQNPRPFVARGGTGQYRARIASRTELQAADASLHRESASEVNGEFRLDHLLPGVPDYRESV